MTIAFGCIEFESIIINANVKTLASRTLIDKWGMEKIAMISEKSYCYSKTDLATGEEYLAVVDIESESEFCLNAKETRKKYINSIYKSISCNFCRSILIDVERYIPKCSCCSAPRLYCCDRGKGGLCGILRGLYSNYWENENLIKICVNNIRDCLKEIQQSGSCSTEPYFDYVIKQHNR